MLDRIEHIWDYSRRKKQMKKRIRKIATARECVISTLNVILFFLLCVFFTSDMFILYWYCFYVFSLVNARSQCCPNWCQFIFFLLLIWRYTVNAFVVAENISHFILYYKLQFLYIIIICVLNPMYTLYPS